MSLKKQLVFETTCKSYTRDGQIGEGGTGSIYKAIDDAGEMYAIKLLRRGKGVTTDKLKRFKNELSFCSTNKHQNIVTVIDHGIFIEGETHSPFYVMPLYTYSLKEHLSLGIPPDRVLFYFSQILDGVEAAHLQRIFHRDLKPENILYDKEQDRLLIADFGVAHFEEDVLHTLVKTQPKDRLANFEYAAPEQRSIGEIVDHRADIYALGLILNKMFTGLVPHGTEYKTIGSVVPDYGYLDVLVSIMLRQSASERPASIEMIKNELIGRKQEFIIHQRISELKQTVVPITDLDDPLIVDPPRLTGFDVESDKLILSFQRPTTAKWVQAWQMMCRTTAHTSFMHMPPERVSFAENKATMSAREDEIQQSIDYFKSWLLLANRVYAQTIQVEKQELENRRRKQLQKEIEEQERRQRILARVKI